MRWIVYLVLAVRCTGDAMAHNLEQRQAGSVSSESSTTFSSKPAVATSGSESAKAAATPPVTAAQTSSHASATVHSGASNISSLSTAPGGETVTVFGSLPTFTATKSSAYQGHGVNATFNSTFTHASTVTTGTGTKLPAGAVLTGSGPQPTVAEIGDIPDDFVACRVNGSDHNQGALCTPQYGQELWVNNIYAVTWNPDLFDHNAQNHIEIHDANTTSSDPAQSLLFNSTPVPNPMGYINIYMNHSFLGPHSGNYTADGMNMSFTLYSTPFGKPTNRTSGPNTTLTINPADLPKVRIKNPIPVRTGLEIGLPIGLVAFIIIGLSIWCGMRKHRRHWSEMQHYGKDYMRKRRGRSGKGNGIELNEYDFEGRTRAERFEDAPTVGGAAGDRNEFREEMERQRKEDWKHRAAKVSSF